MNIRYLFFLIALLLGSYSCSQTNKATSGTNIDEINYDELSLDRGKTIVETVCITCHHPQKSQSDRLGPPLELVKRNYLSISDGERDFILKITDFILRPSKEKASLHEDVDEFGLMDPLGYSKTDVQSVAMYIYRTELERPDWVDSEEDDQ
ncbi:MAG: hypothetical protein BalsKO_28520 [Balneolaceae bacterium]